MVIVTLIHTYAMYCDKHEYKELPHFIDIIIILTTFSSYMKSEILE